MKKTTRIHVNQHSIRHNQYNNDKRPVITVKDYKNNRKTNEAIILDEQGNEVARVVYRPNKPLSCGARVWVETKFEVKVKK